MVVFTIEIKDKIKGQAFHEIITEEEDDVRLLCS